MSSSASALWFGNDNLIEVTGVEDEATDVALNEATGSFTIKTAAGVTVAENVTMEYVAGTSGTYQGTLQSTVSLTHNAVYIIELTLSQSGYVGFWRWEAVAQYRKPD